MKWTMTGRERIKAALTGLEVDRPPLNLGSSFQLHAPLPEDDFLWGWTKERRFLELREYARPWCDSYCGFEPPLFNRYMMVRADRISTETRRASSEKRIVSGRISLPGGDAFYEDHQTAGFATDWHIEVPGDDRSVLDRMIGAPYEVDEAAVERTLALFDALDSGLGENGYPQLFLPSPAVAISHCMHLEDFLVLCFVEPDTVRDYCAEIARRISLCVDALFSRRKLDCAFVFGGSEQFTPPLMRPESFDEFVVPYEGPLVRQLKSHGALLDCHCHGKVSHALEKIVEMGYDATNPVEPPPQGDLDIAQARAIVGDRLTLIGNIEFVEVEHGEPEAIRRRVREIFATGRRRLVITDAALQLRQAVTERMDMNYRAWIDEYAALATAG
jgi:hypothetical protein